MRFAFPLGARLNTTLRARPCQELFSESFSGRPAGRGAPRLPGFGPSRRRVRYYTRPRRGTGGKPARTQDADNSSAAERRGSQAEGGIGWRLASPACEAAPQSRRFTPVHRHNRPGCPTLARLGPPGRTAWPRLHSAAYIKGKSIGERSSVPPSGATPPPEKRDGRLRIPPAFRAGNPLGNRPWSISSTSGRFRLFQYRYGLGTTEHFGRESISAAFGSTMYAQAPRPRSYNQKRREPLTQPSS